MALLQAVLEDGDPNGIVEGWGFEAGAEAEAEWLGAAVAKWSFCGVFL